jgi:hypothetical protein
MTDTRGILTSFGLMFAGSAVSFLFALYWFKRNQAAELAKQERLARATVDKEREDRLIALEKQLSLLGQAVMPISTAFQAILIKELTHFHTPVMDALLARVGPPSLLSDEEEGELAAALEQRTKDMGDRISDSERDAAKMLPLVMKRAKLEALALQPQDTRLRLVTVQELPEERP